MGLEVSLRAGGWEVDLATRKAWSVRCPSVRTTDGRHGPTERSRDAARAGAEVDDLPVVAAALSGLVFVCSALRARHRGRIRELEREIVRLSRVADRDPLTALGNRRSFERCLAVEWRRALRHGSHLTLALVDVDLFKLFNDTYGHPAGDRTLQRVAQCLSGALGRAADRVFRVGGEEFAIILPDTDEAGAALVGRRICDAVRSAALPHSRAPASVVTASFGSCSAVVRDGDEAEELRSLADRALYEAKDGGRDRAVCFRRRPSSDGRKTREGATPHGAGLTCPSGVYRNPELEVPSREHCRISSIVSRL